MRAFTSHTGIAAPFPAENIDTDVIIPMGPLMMTPRAKLGEKAFFPLRYREDGSENPDFVLNRPAYRSASILVAGRNFGCGSSREGAVHALDLFGIRVVIAPTFGDIFFGNCIKNGVLPITLDEARHRQVMSAAEKAVGGAAFSVDLPKQELSLPDGEVIAFEIDPGHKQRLLDGRDEIELTLDLDDRIEAYQSMDRSRQPWVWEIERET